MVNEDRRLRRKPLTINHYAAVGFLDKMTEKFPYWVDLPEISGTIAGSVWFLGR